MDVRREVRADMELCWVREGEEGQGKKKKREVRREEEREIGLESGVSPWKESG